MSDPLHTASTLVAQGHQLRTTTVPQAGPMQGTQRRGTSLTDLVDTLAEPAMLVRNGTLDRINPALLDLLGQRDGTLLRGLPVDAILSISGDDTAALATPSGAMAVQRDRLRMVVSDDQAEVWVIRPVGSAAAPAPTSPASGLDEARALLSGLCEALWNGSPPNDRDLLQVLTGVLDALGDEADDRPDAPVPLPAQTRAPEPSTLADHLHDRATALGWSVDVTDERAGGTPSASVRDLVDAVLDGCVQPGAIRVERDLSGRPALVFQSDTRLLHEDLLRTLRGRAGTVRASLVSMRQGRLLRLRLPTSG